MRLRPSLMHDDSSRPMLTTRNRRYAAFLAGAATRAHLPVFSATFFDEPGLNATATPFGRAQIKSFPVGLTMERPVLDFAIRCMLQTLSL